MSKRILVIDDEAEIRKSLNGVLGDEGYEVVLASSGEEGLERIEPDDPDMVLLDIWLPGRDGIDTLKTLKIRFPNLPVLMMSGHGTIETAVKATKLGAYDFAEKPLNLEKLLLSIERALKASRLEEENRFLRESGRQWEMIGHSPAVEELRQQIRIVGPTRASVLITGENGTGKELVARAIHASSKRSKEPFIEVNCAAIPENLIESELFGHEKGSFTGATDRRRGKFDLSDGGTLFLDEIGDMSLPTQAKILRVLQEMRFERVGGSRTYEVDVRVIAATNKDLEVEIRKGNFREDLFFRLNVVPAEVPPLRDRIGDLPQLVDHFIALYCADEGRRPVGVESEVLEILMAYNWPGNVRELKNISERMVIMCQGEAITTGVVPIAIKEAVGIAQTGKMQLIDGTLKEARRSFEKLFILRRLEDNGWNVPQTAQDIGMEKSGLYKKLKELGIEPPT